MSYIKIETLTKNHLDDAARLVNSQYKDEKKAVPFLPEKYEKQENILPFLNKLIKSISGVAAINNGKLVGFLTGLVVPNFKGNQRGIYCPGCSVNFESYNVSGSNFWMRYFTPVCFSLIRRIDERIGWANKYRNGE